MKKIKNTVKRMLSTVTIFAILAGMLLQPAYADETIRVGFFAFDGYHNEDADGVRSGYGYEFIQKMLRYNNYTAEYVGYDKNWSQMQDMLRAGEIDLLTSAQKTPEREKLFDFSESIGASATILTVKSGNIRYSAGEYSSYDGMRVGVIEGNSRNQSFMDFAASKGFTYTLVYFDNMTDLTAALQDGQKIDAIISSNLRQTKNEWILDTFDVSPFYAMVKKGNTELLDKVNYAIEQMNSNSVGWKDELYDKYYSGSSGDEIALSSTERQYLSELRASGKTIKVTVNPDRAPYSYIENGKMSGILPDIFGEVAERLDLPYEYIMCSTRDEYQELVKSGGIDVIIDGRYDLSAAEDAGYKLTDPYMDLSYSVVERSSFSGEVKSVAALKLEDTSKSNIKYFTGGKDVTYYDTMEECIDAVINKKSDAAYLYDYCGQKYAIENVYGELQSITLPDIKDSLSFGVYDDDDYRLLAVLNKGAASVRDSYTDTVIKKHTDFSLGNLTVFQMLWKNPIILVLIVILFAGLIILILYSYQKRKTNRLQSEKNKELERFIGYVCKANTKVMEVDFSTGRAKEYVLENGNIEIVDSVYQYMDSEKIHRDIPDEDFENIDNTVNTVNIDSIIDNQEDKYFEYRIKEADGEHWYAVTMAAIPRDSQHPKNVIIFKRDIDEIKKQEEAAKQSLRDALETANQASESKGNFLSNMSHEIRTPLNAIIGYLQMAMDDDISEDRLKHCINNCESASRHLLQIINDVLDMSSIESGKIKLAYEEFDLKKELTDITSMFFQNSKGKGVHFETHVEGLTEEWVKGDPLRLNQILMNLLSNAVKFTPEDGKVELAVQQLREVDDRVFIQFKVTDSGIGMSEEYMSRIFKPFEQESAGTARKFGGSGLGLSITNNLIHMMGGNIKVESRQNEGTTFTVTLYFGKAEQKHEKKDVHADYSNVRVLVVDDHENESSYIKTMLKRCGVKSDAVNSGEAALKKIKARQGSDYSYSMCIIDWKMPDMDGGEVTRRIREELGDEVPVIIATAYDVSELEDDAKAAGADKVLAKPLFQSTVFDLLVSTFGKYDPEASRTEKTKRVDMSGIHLLLAEDNVMNMDIAVSMLEKAGIQVDQAVNGKEAVDIFTAAPAGTYDLILMDVQMPVMDGYEATAAIRKSGHPEAVSIPIVAMTANAFAEDVAEALAKGMNAHISKPVNYDKLFNILNQFAGKNPADR